VAYNYHRLEQYKLQHGDCLVSKRFKGDPKLGTWCDTQRVAYKKMKRKQSGMDSITPSTDCEAQSAEQNSERPVIGRLTDERIRRLEDIGFVWSVRDDWQSHFEELKQVCVVSLISDLTVLLYITSNDHVPVQGSTWSL
jgi:Helicase associated domain